MTTTLDITSPVAEVRETRDPAGRIMLWSAAAALVAGPVLWSAGLFTSPPQDSMADADYIESLARDTTLTQVSALLLHYGNLLIAVGILAAPVLVRGSRGAKAVGIGALLTMVGFANVSGMVLADWWNAAAGTHLPMDQAVEIFQTVQSSSLLPLWNGTELFSLVGPILVFVGLARAGVLGRWTLAPFVLGVLAMIALASFSPMVFGAITMVAFSPFVVVGVRIGQRLRLGRA